MSSFANFIKQSSDSITKTMLIKSDRASDSKEAEPSPTSMLGRRKHVVVLTQHAFLITF